MPSVDNIVNGVFTPHVEENSLASYANPLTYAPTPTYQYSPIAPPDFNFTPSQQWLDQLAKSQQQGLFQQQQPLNAPRNAPQGGLWRAQAPNPSALAGQYLKGN